MLPSHTFVSLEASPCFQSLGEFLWLDGTIQGWWNDQRIRMFRRTTSYFFGFLDTILRILGFVETIFAVTAKVYDEDVSRRYKQEIMEFGSPSPMFTILATLAMLNLFSFAFCVERVVVDIQIKALESLALQIILCGVLVLINLPVYQGLFFRKDKGAMPNLCHIQISFFSAVGLFNSLVLVYCISKKSLYRNFISLI
ncbi:cellulose synthase-like protein E1 [Vitis riparia]|uniref:cellulose synthase-like protein E1 n=1 Tax=Vitis riparia TaxID=96939 RepID=UPI00155B2100|nr:cellulose synthase-like protein E1 [Vitis riparia]